MNGEKTYPSLLIRTAGSMSGTNCLLPHHAVERKDIFYNYRSQKKEKKGIMWKKKIDKKILLVNLTMKMKKTFHISCDLSPRHPLVKVLKCGRKK
jgi:hypothetical protein